MKVWLFLLLAVALPAGAGTVYTEVPQSPDPAKQHLIYLHGRIIENAGPRPTDPSFGLYDYPAVLEALSSRGAVVISAQRPPETDMNKYAGVVVSQVEALIDRGVPPGNIVVAGFSKGGGIATRVSNALRRPQVRFVLLAACPGGAPPAGLRLTGHVLSVYEASDTLAESCKPLASQREQPQSFEEIKISTGKLHGAFYLPLPAWVDPVLDWVHRAGTPKHLALARELVANIKPEHNRYSLGDNAISFPGDLLSNKYSMRADCSGFLVALFDRAQYSTQSRMVMLEWSPSRRKYKAEDFVHSIENEKGFKRIQNIEDIRPGDILAHAMLNSEDKRATGTTGHVSLIDSVPRPIPPRKPVVEGTRQYEVSVIDSNEEHVGEDDTRLADPANKIKGLGKGTLRLYADSAGEVVGWARTFKNSNRFFSYTPRFPSDTKARKAAVGRPVTEN